MKILLIHNTYKNKGGEDTVFSSEVNLLKKYNQSVKTLIFNNKDISPWNKLKHGVYSLYNPISSHHLKQNIYKYKPDVIHVHNFFPIASPSLFFVAQKYNIPIVMTLHNYRLLCPNAMFFRDGKVCEKCINKSFPLHGVIHGCYRNSKVETFSLASMVWLHKVIGTWHSKIDRYIALTKFAKNKFVNSSLQIPEHKITVKPNFVKDNGFDYDKEDYYLFVGRLSDEKGIELLLEVFKDSNRKLHIIGSGPLESKVKSFLSKNVFYYGFKSADFIIEKLKKSKALIFSSILYEGMPMTILEAFSTGTPVVCGNIGGPAEMVKNGINGLVYEVGDANSLKQKLEWLDNHPNEVIKLSKNARKHYEKFYSEEKNYKQLMEVYENVIKEKKKNN